jgi:hypothetical protein
MKKTLFIALFSSLLLMGAGCNKEAEQTETSTPEPETSMEETFKTISEAVTSGKSVKCDIQANNESLPEAVNATYWIKDGSLRVEAQYEGQEQAIVVKDNASYVKVQNIFGEQSDCDWFKNEDTEMNANFDMSEGALDANYEQYENDPNYTISCEKNAFDEEKFATPGKVCSIQDLMQGFLPS